jgi:poly-D-alanine transfer protein DltD
MPSNRLKTLVGFVQVITDQTIEQVAGSINYTRAWLTKAMQSPEGNPTLEKLLADKYKKEIAEFFQERELLMEEDSAFYTHSEKVVDAEELLVHDSIIIKGMLRVMLRNQAEILSSQTGKPVSSILKKIEKAVRDETQEEFDEL